MLNEDQIKINKSTLIYITKHYKYKIYLDTCFACIENKLTKCLTITINLIYRSSLRTRIFNKSKNIIPKKHKEIINELIEYYESTILMPYLLTNEPKLSKYVNWFN